MRYEKGHKDTTHKHVVEVASKHFRKNGIEGASIKDLMGNAGLTHGGFYSHFDSKQQLLQQALTQAFTETRSAFSKAGESDGIEGVIRQYLGQSHRDKAEKGCAFAALTQEIARQDKGTRTILADELEAYIDVIAGHISGTDKNAGQTKALQIFSLMIGALQLARAVPDADRSDHILKSAGEAVRLLSSPEKSTNERGRDADAV
jgi:TetR/AcrR family transcriptional regulator, transcriptional repressor for nem operon